jgi:formylglycine-generating enzyme required for sulfatase activity
MFLLSVTMTQSADDDQRNSLLKTFVDEFVAITPGEKDFPKEFQMGDSKGGSTEQPVHKVTMRHKFSIAKYEVPQNLYQSVTGTNPSRWKGPRNSVEMMSWDDANDFCRRISITLRNQKLIADDEEIRLPTEAEWEYCCRAGTTTRYCFGDEAQSEKDVGRKASLLDKFAWHTGNAAGNDPPVGALKPNEWGLYDMHGYLWEFTSDAWSPNYNKVPGDGTAVAVTDKTTEIVIRGGSWKDSFERLTSATRKSVGRTDTDDAIGFRCILSKIAK